MAPDCSTDPNPNRSCSVELGPNSVYALVSLGTTPISLISTPCKEVDHVFPRIPSSNHSWALELAVPDPTTIAAAILSILSISADSTQDPREREIVRVVIDWPAQPLLIHPERIGVDG